MFVESKDLGKVSAVISAIGTMEVGYDTRFVQILNCNKYVIKIRVVETNFIRFLALQANQIFVRYLRPYFDSVIITAHSPG